MIIFELKSENLMLMPEMVILFSIRLLKSKEWQLFSHLIRFDTFGMTFQHQPQAQTQSQTTQIEAIAASNEKPQKLYFIWNEWLIFQADDKITIKRI